ncbi:hypothetical protein DA075_22340 [Methylobacterium currus]|uniref:Uncharacterized protein n=1 Tax=Methylobacterium currus TaxID=2051553 RepID=A0A2R4WP44_9HYPH|nr:hypothetical protein [Methylobacterium currus]AWB23299.1 hypothetical protein DA075_22340 [Methylobacterium currus]
MSTNPSTDDQLDLIAQLATEVANEVAAEYAPDRLHEADPRYVMLNVITQGLARSMLDRVRTILMQSARHVPVAVDEILELAVAQGGYRP